MSNSTGGLNGVATLLLVGFIALKLTGVIDWSWWWAGVILLANALLSLFVLFSRQHIAQVHVLDLRSRKDKLIKKLVDKEALGHFAVDGSIYAISDTSFGRNIVPLPKDSWDVLKESDLGYDDLVGVAHNLVEQAADRKSAAEMVKNLLG